MSNLQKLLSVISRSDHVLVREPAPIGLCLTVTSENVDDLTEALLFRTDPPMLVVRDPDRLLHKVVVDAITVVDPKHVQ